MLMMSAALSPACGSSGVTNVSGPTPTHCQISATNSSSSFGMSGGDGTITVNVARECSWSAASQAGWITITSGNSGQGDGTVNYHVAANPDAVARRSTIMIGDQQASVAQDPAPCKYDVSGATDPLAASGGSAAITVQTNGACSWTAASNALWVTVSPLTGSGDATVRVTAPANTGPRRIATVTVAATPLTVTQLGTSGPPTIDLSDKVSTVRGTCPSLTFNLQNRLVQTSASTQFASGLCKDLVNGANVSVHGTVQSDGSVAALKVTFIIAGS